MDPREDDWLSEARRVEELALRESIEAAGPKIEIPLEADLLREYRRIRMVDLSVGNPLSSTAFQVYALLDVVLGILLFAVVCTVFPWAVASLFTLFFFGLFTIFGRRRAAGADPSFIESAETPIGPLTWLLIVRHRARLREIAGTLPEPTPEVIEQIARRIAEPLLQQARYAANYAPAPQTPERIERRLSELRRELHAEKDPTWRAAIETRIAALDEDRREIERAMAAHTARSKRLRAEADALESALDQMARRTRLLRELAQDRAEDDHAQAHAADPRLGFSPGSEGLDPLADLRARLADLGETLRSHEELARSRAAAEIEIKEP